VLRDAVNFRHLTHDKSYVGHNQKIELECLRLQKELDATQKMLDQRSAEYQASSTEAARLKEELSAVQVVLAETQKMLKGREHQVCRRSPAAHVSAP